MKKFAVIGKPINHSLSPKIHAEFAKILDMDISYEAIEVDPKDFKSLTRALFERGYDGLNVTLPLKELAYQLADEPSLRAKETEAANTLWLDNGKIFADSTDGKGLKEDLLSNSICVESISLLIIGAGGAARSILPSVIELAPKQIFVSNRTHQKAVDLVEKYKERGVEISPLPIHEVPKDRIEGIIHTSSAGLKGEVLKVNENVFKSALWVYDLSYDRGITPFNQLAKNYGVEICIDGLGMLINQGAASFEIWTGLKPSADKVLKKIRRVI